MRSRGIRLELSSLLGFLLVHNLYELTAALGGNRLLCNGREVRGRVINELEAHFASLTVKSIVLASLSLIQISILYCPGGSPRSNRIQ